ncbi:MAG: peptidyl-alpha-hydroxyglycine alpha-amidating lyase family protein [Bdellovibrionia bacterium]
MKKTKTLLFALVVAGAVVAVPGQEKGGVDVTGPYDAVPNWFKPVEAGRLLWPVAVFAESPDRIFAASLGTTPAESTGGVQPNGFDAKLPGAKIDHQLYVLDRNGKIIEDWSKWSELFGALHRITINPYDAEKHIWAIDRTSQQLLEFTHDGKTLLRSIGEKGVAGNDDKHFGRPTDIAWFPDGTFFVSDGYDNSRIVKFDKSGTFVNAWGTKGNAPGQFNRPHSIAVDANRRVYVADRLNARIQIFDENGTFIEQWRGFVSPVRVVVTQDQSVWVLDLGASRLAKYDTNGKLLTYWGTSGRFPGGFADPHDFAVDPEGNLYISNGHGHHFDKYVPKPGADKSRLTGQPFAASVR